MTNKSHNLLAATLALGRHKSTKLLMCIVTASLLVPGAKADFVNGTFTIGGTSVTATANELLFWNLGTSLTQPTGEFEATAPGTGNFDTIVNGGIDPPGTDASILDLTGISPDPLCTGCGYAPVNNNNLAINWIDFPNITVELTGITAPSAPTCGSLTPTALATPNTDCTPNTASTLLLTNNLNVATGAIDTGVAISAVGSAWFNSTPGQVSSAQISLSSTITGQNINQVLATEANTGAVITGLEGQVVITGGVPEPGTLSMMLGSGLLALGFMLRRRRS
jgi:hypothetical protein